MQINQAQYESFDRPPTVKRSSSMHFFSWLMLLLLLSFAEAPLRAQTIQIKLIDGRSGRPMARAYVNVWVGHDRKDATAIPTSPDGIATLKLTNEAIEVDMSRSWNGAGLSGVIIPLFMYNDDIQINVGYALCEVGGGKYSWLSIRDYSVQGILHTGFTSPNTCGTAAAESMPGVVTIFARPLNWLEKLKQ